MPKFGIYDKESLKFKYTSKGTTKNFKNHLRHIKVTRPKVTYTSSKKPDKSISLNCLFKMLISYIPKSCISLSGQSKVEDENRFQFDTRKQSPAVFSLKGFKT